MCHFCDLQQGKAVPVCSLQVAYRNIPSSKAEAHRLDPSNGIALNTLHDKAFDMGLITFDKDLRLLYAPSLRYHYTNETVSLNFKGLEGKPSMSTNLKRRRNSSGNYLAYGTEG